MSAPTDRPVIRIRPTRGWASLGLADLWAYRDLLYFLAWREIKARYRLMALGPLWIVLVPLVNMLVFVVITSLAGISSGGAPRVLFIYSALLPWQLFAEGARESTGSLVRNLDVISKVYFPRMVVPLSATFAALADFCAGFVILMVLMLAYGYTPTLAMLALPAFLLVAIATTMAVGLWLAAVAVKLRDIHYGIVHLLQVWFLASGTFYESSMIPQPWNTLFRLNPMVTVIDGFRWALLDAAPAPDAVTAVSVGLLLVLLVTGAYVFRRTERNMVDFV